MTATEVDPTDLTGRHIRSLYPAEVPDDLAAHVLDVAHRVAGALALPCPVVIVFYAACPPDHPDAEEVPRLATTWGFHVQSRPGHVYLRFGRTLAETESTLVHECRHEWQRVHVGGQGGRFSRAELEADAHAYAARWMAGNV